MSVRPPTAPRQHPSRPTRGPRGFLLAEALLTLVVVATGLVFVSRGLSTSLHAVRRLTETARLLRLTETTLRTQEMLAYTTGVAPSTAVFASPDEAYRWALAAEPLTSPLDATMTTPLAVVRCTVHPAAGERPALSLTSLWPAEWVQP